MTFLNLLPTVYCIPPSTVLMNMNEMDIPSRTDLKDMNHTESSIVIKHDKE